MTVIDLDEASPMPVIASNAADEQHVAFVNSHVGTAQLVAQGWKFPKLTMVQDWYGGVQVINADANVNVGATS